MSEEKKAPVAELVVAYIGAFLLFPVGLFLGVNLLRRDYRADGTTVIAVASAIGVLSVLGAFVIEDRAFVLALPAIAIALGIRLAAQGRLVVGITITAVSLILVLGVIVGDDESDRVKAQRQEEKSEKEDRQVEEQIAGFEHCLVRHPYKTCWRRYVHDLYGK